MQCRDWAQQWGLCLQECGWHQQCLWTLTDHLLTAPLPAALRSQASAWPSWDSQPPWGQQPSPWTFQLTAEEPFDSEHSALLAGLQVDQPPSASSTGAASLSEVAAAYLRRGEGSSPRNGPGPSPTAFSPFSPTGNGPSVIWDANFGLAADDGNVCVVCLEREAGQTAMLPCGHTHCCMPCAAAMQAKAAPCPICRGPIQQLRPLKR